MGGQVLDNRNDENEILTKFKCMKVSKATLATLYRSDTWPAHPEGHELLTT